MIKSNSNKIVCMEADYQNNEPDEEAYDHYTKPEANQLQRCATTCWLNEHPSEKAQQYRNIKADPLPRLSIQLLQRPARHRSNENKMSCAGRGRAPLRLEVF